MYQPWTSAHGTTQLLPFQKVVSMLDPFTLRVFAVPATWPPSGEDDLLGKLALTQARTLMSDGDSEAQTKFSASADASLHDLLKRVGLPPGTIHYKDVSPEVIHILSPASGYGPKAIQDLKERGYRGNILPADVGDTVVFRDWDILVAGLASLILNLPGDLREYLNERMPMAP